MTLKGFEPNQAKSKMFVKFYIAFAPLCMRKRKLSISISKIIKQKDLRGVRTHVAKKYYTCKY